MFTQQKHIYSTIQHLYCTVNKWIIRKKIIDTCTCHVQILYLTLLKTGSQDNAILHHHPYRVSAWVWSCATSTIENMREGSSSSPGQFVALSFVKFRVSYCDCHYPQCLTVLRLMLKFQIESIPKII